MLMLTSCSSTRYQISITAAGEWEDWTGSERSVIDQMHEDYGIQLKIHADSTQLEVGSKILKF